MMISVIRKIPDRSLDANNRNTTAVKMTGSTILQMYHPSFRDLGPRWINNTKNVPT